MLALGYNCPKVNLQNENPAGLMDILKLVNERIPESVGETSETRNEKENQLAFQVTPIVPVKIVSQ